jgi:hypothetical protein
MPCRRLDLISAEDKLSQRSRGQASGNGGQPGRRLWMAFGARIVIEKAGMGDQGDGRQWINC